MEFTIVAIFVVSLILARGAGFLAAKLSVPTVLAELLAGVVIGNLISLPKSSTFHLLSEAGVLLLLLTVGLETDVREIRRVGKDAILVAFLGVVAPFALAFATLPLVYTGDLTQRTFLAAVLTATSVGITARVLRDAGKLQSVSGQIILGAAVIDDILGIIVLALVAGATVSSGLVVAAFALGLLLRKYRGIEAELKPINAVLIPFFFVYTGMSVKLADLANPDAFVLGTALTLCALAGKAVCGFGISRDTVARGADRWLVGVGMIPRGEVGLIFAATGLQTKVIGGEQYSAAVAMVGITTLLAPLLIGWRLSATREKLPEN